MFVRAFNNPIWVIAFKKGENKHGCVTGTVAEHVTFTVHMFACFGSVAANGVYFTLLQPILQSVLQYSFNNDFLPFRQPFVYVHLLENKR